MAESSARGLTPDEAAWRRFADARPRIRRIAPIAPAGDRPREE
ncbi:MAG TPA: hypothetical protein VK932_01840 [Kofleriaceae bacterium]|nr:hypothetical protein [Kofleriaceae bacterium]